MNDLSPTVTYDNCTDYDGMGNQGRVIIKESRKMNDISRLFTGIIIGSLAQVLTFIQLQGQLKWNWVKNNYWLIVLLGIPVSMLFMYSVKNLVIAFGGQMWPSRLIGFSIGTIVFTIMSLKFFDEPLTTKTIVCLLLAIVILAIQLFIK